MDHPRHDTVYLGDNLSILRDEIPDACVDLVYLDPPFKTNQDYHVIFADADASPRAKRVKAFADTWRWDDAAAQAWDETLERGPAAVADALRAFRTLVGTNDMLAYLCMIAPRLVELRRAMRATASIYLHCDPTSSHYLKVLMDAVFGAQQCRREIVWRSGWVSGFKARTRNWVRNHDVILYYVRDADAAYAFNKDLAYRPHAEGYARRGGGSNPKGVALDDVWDENALYSPWIKSFSKEKLGWQTQKPLALLERVIRVSSNDGDLVLDPFCGSGTTLAAAQALGRRWIGVDVSEAAVAMTRERVGASAVASQ